jgi:hypothetical protein
VFVTLKKDYLGHKAGATLDIHDEGAARALGAQGIAEALASDPYGPLMAKAVEASVTALSKQLDTISNKTLEVFARAQGKSNKNAIKANFGEGGQGDPQHNFGDFCLAVAAKNLKRLEEHYKTFQVDHAGARVKAALGEASGSAKEVVQELLPPHRIERADRPHERRLPDFRGPSRVSRPLSSAIRRSNGPVEAGRVPYVAPRGGSSHAIRSSGGAVRALEGSAGGGRPYPAGGAGRRRMGKQGERPEGPLPTEKKMSEFLAGVKDFAVVVDEAFDTVDDEGFKLQSNRRRRIWVSRPDRLRSESTGDATDLLFVFQKGGFLLLDKENNSYIAEKGPDTIDGMLDELVKKYDRIPPLSDFVRADSYKSLSGGVREARYVGPSQIGDSKCHHLAFRQKLLDWQLWVEDGDKPLPRKLVITYKREAGQPQYTAVFHRWQLDANKDRKLFDLTPPAGAKQVEIAPAELEKKNP